MTAQQLALTYLMGPDPIDVGKLTQLLLACHDQGARNQVANWRTWQDERLNMHTEFTKPEFSVTWPVTDQETIPANNKK